MEWEMWILPSQLTFVPAALSKTLRGQQGHQEGGSVLTGKRMDCPIPGGRLEGALRKTALVEGGPAHGGWSGMVFKDPSK